MILYEHTQKLSNILEKLKKGGNNMTNENTVFIGKKSPMDYVLAVITQFNRGSNEVVIKSRGQSISRSVDVAEITRRKFLPNVVVSNIEIGTEELQRNDGTKSNVSTMAITLLKE